MLIVIAFFAVLIVAISVYGLVSPPGVKRGGGAVRKGLTDQTHTNRTHTAKRSWEGKQSMSLRNGIALTCIAIPAIIEIMVGVTYFTASEVMPYHKEVLGVAWSDLQPGVRAMLVGLMNAYGSTHFAVGVALIILVLIPLRRGYSWARWAILAVGLPVLSATVYLAARAAFATEAQTPWRGSLVLLGLFLVGVALADPKQSVERGPEPDAP